MKLYRFLSLKLRFFHLKLNKIANHALSDKLFTFEEYIEFEENSEIRHEFYEGHLYPIEATSRVHNEIIQNVVALIPPLF